jgi:hypothetical protein
MLWICCGYPLSFRRTWTDRSVRPISGAMNIGTLLFTWLHGKRVGTDETGHV